MSEPFLAEIKIISWNFPPKGWAFCNGQLLPINQNQALFSVLGTTYGGDGRQTFGLPNLQGRLPIHVGNGHTLGEMGGETTHTVNISEMPAHSHAPMYIDPAIDATATYQATPGGNFWAPDPNGNVTFASSGNEPMASSAIDPVGGNQPHNNLAPYLVLNFVIALQGIFPSQT